ncbi:MAG: hypothetical protein KJ871_02955 [Alphaproteobacteria bacterium]|nr:hypothetical protein [Alphaproteobacteria bacterium]MBU2082970.1 hypothetical protein [Alphaproteobacteria bacterium]MBU2143107.1 hypothetical protein [Alphaproteobacteria bacterium]
MRSAFLIFSALTAGLALGRKFLAGEIASRKNKVIEAAAQKARQRIREQANIILKDSFVHFAAATGIKLLILITLWLFWRTQLLGHEAISVAVIVCLVGFVVRDAWVIYPTARFVLSTLVRNGWHPIRALGETVAALVFEEVLIEAEAVSQPRTHMLLIKLSGHDQDTMHKEIAAAVADIARQSSWLDLRPYIFSAAAKTLSLMIIYGATVALLISRLPHY